MSQSLITLTQEEMIRRGAYGFLSRAVECEIPVSRVVQVSPEPACEDWGAYPHAVAGQPVEVKYARDEDAYLLFAGLALLKDARRRGDTHLPAFVEPDDGGVGAAVRPRPMHAKTTT